MITLGRLVFGLLVLGIGAGFFIGRFDSSRTTASAASADEKRSDLDAIRGSWMRISTDGVETDPTIRKMRMVIRRDTDRSETHLPAGAGLFVFEWRTKPGGLGTTNQVMIDPTTKPRTLDFFPEGPAAPKVCPGIYKLEGDVLTICFLSIEGERPKGFDERRRNQTLDVYRRVKP